MIPNGLLVKNIHPRYGSKFSANLYRFLARKRTDVATYGRVYKDADGTWWLGYHDDIYLIGSRLIDVLCNGSATETGAHVRLGPLNEVVDFWTRYQAIGRCAIDEDHAMLFRDDGDRFILSGSQRLCTWCGHVTASAVRPSSCG